jgi:hypothetical protein
MNVVWSQNKENIKFHQKAKKSDKKGSSQRKRKAMLKVEDKTISLITSEFWNKYNNWPETVFCTFIRENIMQKNDHI